MSVTVIPDTGVNNLVVSIGSGASLAITSDSASETLLSISSNTEPRNLSLSSSGGNSIGLSSGLTINNPAPEIPEYSFETVNEDGSSRTLSASDFSKKIRLRAAGGCSITLPPDIGEANAVIIFRRTTGAGQPTLSNVGVTVNNSSISSISAGQEFALVCVGVNEWDFV